ncbi:hypothetical protein CC80DRAFT_506448 [Byssothecium circinans]|uniref:Uncharacterized protein n=1 Tax=Byssothecium circinans TaxID=147558 RepID=A0A6A5TP06_9PLEO|nr:hypothetical protein CC80DRAFT_506448 [Byssothecium circinans]
MSHRFENYSPELYPENDRPWMYDDPVQYPQFLQPDSWSRPPGTPLWWRIFPDNGYVQESPPEISSTITGGERWGETVALEPSHSIPIDPRLLAGTESSTPLAVETSSLAPPTPQLSEYVPIGIFASGAHERISNQESTNRKGSKRSWQPEDTDQEDERELQRARHALRSNDEVVRRRLLAQNRIKYDAGSSRSNGVIGPPSSAKPSTSRVVGKKASKTYHRRPLGFVRMARLLNRTLPPEAIDGPIHGVYSTAPPRSANITLMGDLVVTSIELLTFFPHHLDWQDWVKRIAGAKWGWTEAIRFMCKARGIDAIQYMSNIVNNLCKKAAKAKPAYSAHHPSTVFSCQNWTPPEKLRLMNYHVLDLAEGVLRSEFPTGVDKGPLTYAIEFARDHPTAPEVDRLMLNGLPQFIQEKGFDNCIPSLGLNITSAAHPDVEACERHGGKVRH